MLVIDKETDKYTLKEGCSVAEALEKLNHNKRQVLFITDSKDRLTGAFTDGDFRRWVLKQTRIDIGCNIINAMNHQYCCMSADDDRMAIAEMINQHIEYLPLVDNQGRIVAVASRQESALHIAGSTISKDSPCFIIAEIGNNHNGSLEAAKKLVDAAVDAGADCVKFQMRDLASLYSNAGKTEDVAEDLGSQYVLDLLNQYQLTDDEFKAIFTYCAERSVVALCTPFDVVSADKLTDLNVPAFKVASADLTNHTFLKYLAQKNLPLIVSTGMATEEEIESTVNLLNGEGAQFVLLHCNSTYPAPFKDVNLRYLKRLADFNNGLIGYSGHERGFHVATAAVAMGAKVVEKHFTLDRNQPGNDHRVSLLPHEFKEMVNAVRQVELALGDDRPRRLTQGEMMNRENLGKSIVTKTAIAKDQIITADMLDIKSPGKGLPPYQIEKLLGKRAVRDMSANDFFYASDLGRAVSFKRENYALPGKFGVPVRYHDLGLIQETDLKVVEFHLSYQDLLVNPDDYLDVDRQRQCVVHAPELFVNDHVLDLASNDDAYRRLSVQHMNGVLDIVRKLKTYYPNTRKVPVVVNVGGFSENQFLDASEREDKYRILADSLTQLDLREIELLIQTMPPFPWHFGGQRYHNLFVRPQEIAAFCHQQNVSVCLDISHSFLAANYLEIELWQYFRVLGERIKHLHISDGKGVDDEGLQIRDGDVDFTRVFTEISNACPQASWIPEVWQGHKNNGEGFWIAFDRLEKAWRDTMPDRTH